MVSAHGGFGAVCVHTGSRLGRDLWGSAGLAGLFWAVGGEQCCTRIPVHRRFLGIHARVGGGARGDGGRVRLRGVLPPPPPPFWLRTCGVATGSVIWLTPLRGLCVDGAVRTVLAFASRLFGYRWYCTVTSPMRFVRSGWIAVTARGRGVQAPSGARCNSWTSRMFMPSARAALRVTRASRGGAFTWRFLAFSRASAAAVRFFIITGGGCGGCMLTYCCTVISSPEWQRKVSMCGKSMCRFICGSARCRMYTSPGGTGHSHIMCAPRRGHFTCRNDGCMLYAPRSCGSHQVRGYPPYVNSTNLYGKNMIQKCKFQKKNNPFIHVHKNDPKT